ncbi:cryptochrome/photolyase family protein [Sunxiuqinia sp. A32]|uniref:cryptochrome/photolyase family protein n=1 Tax=Sunxiuqinia sp. A32 TaxID=3461496 RepID=UPI0040462ABA
MKEKINIMWFRRDLRIADNHAFFRSLSSKYSVLPIFIFDSQILNDLDDDDARLGFILGEVNKLKKEFEENNSTFWIYHGKPLNAFKRLLVEFDIDTIYANRDYEPYALERDQRIAEFLAEEKVKLETLKDQLIFDQNDILKKDGKPYTVFTPYSRRWLEKFQNLKLENYPSKELLVNLFKSPPLKTYHLRDLGFRPGNYPIPKNKISRTIIEEYEEKRDFPGIDATSRLGIHLRFGAISIRKLTKQASKYSSIFLNELIWRNFYMDILWHFPHVEKESFKKEYDRIPWINSEKDFQKWCDGNTGYPLVDAGMRQLNQTGFMHNRVRMVTASFLCKHLLIDWRWGEAYFAEKLLDYELASNNGGWQWAAGSGCDAAPYFRIFNPTLQAQKFDPEFKYIKKWIPEFGTDKYPKPIVEHKFARERAIKTYKIALER